MAEEPWLGMAQMAEERIGFGGADQRGCSGVRQDDFTAQRDAAHDQR